jgi:hypothetical protein
MKARRPCIAIAALALQVPASRGADIDRTAATAIPAEKC